MVKVLREEMLYAGVSVIIPRRECIQTASRSKREQKVKVEEAN
jgi:indolepyruvate ferredoxin oxidoreductase alpha subunit